MLHRSHSYHEVENWGPGALNERGFEIVYAFGSGNRAENSDSTRCHFRLIKENA